ncbi:ABATE domain-containing protein [Mycobacterium tilburgii]|uniref:ABATE domain-containing protein n=1 Tax=Mycobacterium tilburgii TaxID=44467 RepID=UPI0016429F35|nr:ABATE domain-containing protein [Mycobacterium tilburgii]
MFGFVSGRLCLDFAGTLKRRNSTRQERLTVPSALSEWAVQARLVDADIEVTAEDLVSATEVREAIYRTTIARLDGAVPRPADVELRAGGAAPADPATADDRRHRARGHRGATDRQPGRSARPAGRAGHRQRQALAYPDYTLLYVDSSRAKNRTGAGMATCGNKVKVQAFRVCRRASAHWSAG